MARKLIKLNQTKCCVGTRVLAWFSWAWSH